MNTRFLKWLLSVTTFFCMILVAINVAAKKPVKPPPTNDDPCSNLEVFSPDFAFWRDTGNRKSPKATIFLAQSDIGCEKSLVDFPIISPITHVRNLKFSSVEDGSGYFGRIVWTSNIGSRSVSIWMQDFNIDGADVALDGGKLEILRNTLLDDTLESENIYSLDLSPDTRTLVFQYANYYPDPNYADTNLGRRSLRILDIDSCANADTEPCRFDDLNNAYVYELDHAIGTTSESIGFYFPTWGPYGERVYVRKGFDTPELGRQQAIKYYNFEGGWQESEWPPTIDETGTFGFDLYYFLRIASGMMGGEEYLAIEKEFSEKTGGCEGIYIVKVNDCLFDVNCLPEPEFAGAYPSWTKDGKLIHAYDGWVPHGGCGLSSVGLWDGSDDSLESLFTGYQPDAAGGVR